MWPIQKCDPFDPLTNRPIACSDVLNLFLSFRSRACLHRGRIVCEWSLIRPPGTVVQSCPRVNFFWPGPIQLVTLLSYWPDPTHPDCRSSDICLKCGLDDNDSSSFRKHFSNALVVAVANQRMLMKLLSHDEVHGSWVDKRMRCSQYNNDSEHVQGVNIDNTIQYSFIRTTVAWNTCCRAASSSHRVRRTRNA